MCSCLPENRRILELGVKIKSNYFYGAIQVDRFTSTTNPIKPSG